MKRALRYSYCEKHRKRRYQTRKDAKKAIRMWHATGQMREYPCTVAPWCWHVGHLPQATEYGLLTSREVYRGVKVTLSKDKTRDGTLTIWYTPGPGNPVRPREGEPFAVAWFNRTASSLDIALSEGNERDGNDGTISIPWHQIATIRFGPDAPWPAYPNETEH